jgi:hypothetical protein
MTTQLDGPLGVIQTARMSQTHYNCSAASTASVNLANSYEQATYPNLVILISIHTMTCQNIKDVYSSH